MINRQTDRQNEEGLTDMERIYAETLKDIREGQVVKGKIINISSEEVMVDVGYKSEGFISMTEFEDPSSLKIGDEVEVLVETKENEEGLMVLSKRKAEKAQGWDRLIQKYREGDTIEGKVTKRVKGGLMVDVGAEAFLPASQVSLRGFGNLNQQIGQVLKFKVIKINMARRNIVLSRREYLQGEKEESKARLLQKLEVGQTRSGIVKNITDFGAFIDLGGLDGLLYITDISWGRISHPSEVLAVGDKIDVMILSFDKEKMRVSLGLKQITPSPWEDIESKYPVGSRVKGVVVNIVPYGAFVELEKGVEGLVHISELSWTKRITSPQEMLAIGDKIEIMVLDINKKNQKISLGIKQLETNPWIEAKARYPIGTQIRGKVRSLTDYGAFVELDEGIEGLIHISDLSWTKKISHPSEVLKKFQKIEAVVLAVDEDNRKMSLGLKQLTPNPWPQIMEKYRVGLIVEVQVTKVTNFGIFVELEKDLEGLVHISELSPQPQVGPEESPKIGDRVRARVIKVDSEQRKIALSMKDL